MPTCQLCGGIFSVEVFSFQNDSTLCQVDGNLSSTWWLAPRKGKAAPVYSGCIGDPSRYFPWSILHLSVSFPRLLNSSRLCEERRQAKHSGWPPACGLALLASPVLYPCLLHSSFPDHPPSTMTSVTRSYWLDNPCSWGFLSSEGMSA